MYNTIVRPNYIGYFRCLKCYKGMIKTIVDLLNTSEHFGISERVEIAKGKYQIKRNWKDGLKQIKRRWLKRKP